MTCGGRVAYPRTPRSHSSDSTCEVGFASRLLVTAAQPLSCAHKEHKSTIPTGTSSPSSVSSPKDSVQRRPAEHGADQHADGDGGGEDHGSHSEAS